VLRKGCAASDCIAPAERALDERSEPGRGVCDIGLWMRGSASEYTHTWTRARAYESCQSLCGLRRFINDETLQCREEESRTKSPTSLIGVIACTMKGRIVGASSTTSRAEHESPLDAVMEYVVRIEAKCGGVRSASHLDPRRPWRPTPSLNATLPRAALRSLRCASCGYGTE
jgi:hypothetical protein